MRIVFCGTPEFAVSALRALLSHEEFAVEAVVTQPDRPRGRGQSVSASPVKEVALGAGVQVYQPEKIKSDSAYDFFKRVAPDVVVIIAYGQIIPARLIAIPPLGWINLHASLLPKYRGAAPIAWAVVNGESTTGLTTMQIDAGMDTGPILLQQELTIGAEETAPELALRMTQAGAPLVIDSLIGLARRQISGRSQDSSLATYAPRLEKDHGRVDWSQTASQIYNRIRGLDPWPGTYTRFRGQLCHIWGRPCPAVELIGQEDPLEAAPGQFPAPERTSTGTILVHNGTLRVLCGQSTALEITQVQLEGRRRITAQQFLNGAHLTPGERFGD
jgi:methionyl-tRNA formyltransferase